MHDLIITGIPRAGTSLACAIIDRLPNAICLSEPDHQVGLMDVAKTPDEFVNWLGEDFGALRRTLLAGNPVLDRRGDGGESVTNYFGARTSQGRRCVSYKVTPISRAGLTPDFLLGIKHNALYVAVLPEIIRSGRFGVAAIVRDPVAVLLSWRSLDLPVSRGCLPAAERFWLEMASLTRCEMDLTDKQIRICDLFCRRFAALAGSITVVRYEDCVINPSLLLAGCEMERAATTVLIERRDSSAEESEAAPIAKRICAMTQSGQLPGISHFYPSYLGGR